MAVCLAASTAFADCTGISRSSGFGIGGVNGSRVTGTTIGTEALTTALIANTTAFQSQTSALIGAPGNPLAGQEGGGVWVRGAGGTFDTRTSGSVVIAPDGAGNGRQVFPCSTRTFSDYSGVQLGTDVSRLNIDGGNLHLGVTAGYTELFLRSPTANGTVNVDLQVPFLGVYGAFTKGGFYADGQVRWDFFQGVLSNPREGLFDHRLDARSLSLIGNVGHQFQLGDGWYVEPSAGGIYSEAKIDPLVNTNNRLFQDGNAFPRRQTPPASAKTEDIESILGRLSVRVGKTVVVDGYVLQPFVTASVFHEFAGAYRTSIVTLNGQAFGDAPRALDTTAVQTSNRIGTYGQFGLGVAGQLSGSWLGYVRGDYRTGDRVDGWGISGGLRYQFAPEALGSRALVSKDGPAPLSEPIVAVSWTGLTVGGAVGAGWSTTRQAFPLAANPSVNPPPTGNNAAGLLVGPLSFGPSRIVNPDAAGILAGGMVGGNYQVGRIVVGVAGDFDWTNARGAKPCPNAVYYACETNTDLLILATGRLGYTWGRSLFYAKGGAAFADVREGFRDNTAGQPLFSYVTTPSSAGRAWAAGWALGGGFEFALSTNWSARAEYMHYELEDKRIAYRPAAYAADARHTGDTVKIGLNYRFGSPLTVEPAPILAKY